MGQASRLKRQRRTSEKIIEPRSFILTDYLIGFFDVVGQSTKLRQLKQVPTTDTETQQTIALLKQTVGVVLGVRRMFDDFFQAASQPTSYLKSLPPAAQQQVLSATRSEVKRWGISDSLIVAVPLMETGNPTLAVNGVRQSLIAAAGMWLLSLAAGHPLRGGIDVGVGLQIGPNEVYGSALDSAYRLESKVAGGPRIVVGATCIDYLNSVASRAASDPLKQLAQHAARECLSLLRQDEDGQFIVDGLGPVMLNLVQTADALGNKGELRSVATTAHDAVKKQLAEARASGNVTLISRYEALQRYFDSNIGGWQTTSA